MTKKDESKPVQNRDNEQENAEGYPLYPPKDDIYNRFKEEQNLDPEDPTRLKEDIPAIDPETLDNPELDEDDMDVPELDFNILHTDLDIPGADLDDQQEEIGSEDEENNYYSIGGDNHHDLEEDEGLFEDDEV